MYLEARDSDVFFYLSPSACVSRASYVFFGSTIEVKNGDIHIAHRQLHVRVSSSSSNASPPTKPHLNNPRNLIQVPGRCGRTDNIIPNA
jgi:hypothetical protein